MKKILIYSCALLLLTACGNSPQPAENTPDETVNEVAAEKNATDEVSSSVVINEAFFNGVLIVPPERHAIITLPVDGIIKSASLLPGKYVRKGELLATLENPEFIDLQQSYLESSAQAEYLEAEYLRQEALSKEEAASQKKFQQSKADYLSVKSKKDAAAAQLAMLGVDPASLHSKGIVPLLEVKAPINGYLSGLQINLGKHISAGEPLCEVIDKSEILIKLTVYEKDLDKIAVDDEVEFRVNGMGTEVFYGRIISIGQQVDHISRSLEVYARVIENDSRFRPGMYVNVRVIQK